MLTAERKKDTEGWLVPQDESTDEKMVEPDENVYLALKKNSGSMMSEEHIVSDQIKNEEDGDFPEIEEVEEVEEIEAIDD